MIKLLNKFININLKILMLIDITEIKININHVENMI